MHFTRALEKKTVVLQLKVDDLRYWDENRKQFVVENDKIELMGSSSDDFGYIGIVAAQ